jgi:hypothetical protein
MSLRGPGRGPVYPHCLPELSNSRANVGPRSLDPLILNKRLHREGSFASRGHGSFSCASQSFFRSFKLTEVRPDEKGGIEGESR